MGVPICRSSANKPAQQERNAGRRNRPRASSLWWKQIYAKNISFESPNTPQMFQEKIAREYQPRGEVNEAQQRRRHRGGAQCSGQAKACRSRLYSWSRSTRLACWCPGFVTRNSDALLGVAVPNILFPYAREAVSDLVTACGSFPSSW